jgi:hypothetical protein
MRFFKKIFVDLYERIQLEIAYRKAIKEAKKKDPFIY